MWPPPPLGVNQIGLVTSERCVILDPFCRWSSEILAPEIARMSEKKCWTSGPSAGHSGRVNTLVGVPPGIHIDSKIERSPFWEVAEGRVG